MATRAPPLTTVRGEAAPRYGVKVDEPVGAPVAETVPDAAGVVVGLLGIGKGAADEVGRTTADELVVTAAGEELLVGAAEAVGFGAGADVLPKSAGRVMPLSRAH